MFSTPRSPEPNTNIRDPPSTLVKLMADPIKHVGQQTVLDLDTDSVDKLQMQMRYVPESDMSLQKIVDPRPFASQKGGVVIDSARGMLESRFIDEDSARQMIDRNSSLGTNRFTSRNAPAPKVSV